MREYIITIEDWFFKHMHERYTHFFGCPIEEIVRCRECAYYERENDDEGMCMFPDDDGDYARWMVDEDGFCYLGIRRVSE